MSSVTVTVLGSGDAFASHGRFQAGYVIGAGRRLVLMEAGPGVLTTLKRSRVKPSALDAVLISHLHGDHFAGLPFLILEYMYESPRRRPLLIAGPRGLEERTWALMRAMYRGFDTSAIEARLKWTVLEPGKAATLAGMRLATIRTPHTRPDVSLALRIRVGGKTIVFTGDTGWTDELVPFAAGADLFLCECTYFSENAFRYHLNYLKLIRRRDEFRVGRMVLTHLGREVIENRRQVRIEMAADGKTIKL